MEPFDPEAVALLDAVSDPAAIVDATGAVVYVNHAWTDFCRANSDGGSPTMHATCGRGTSYQVWVDDPTDPDARRAARGVLDVVAGATSGFQMVYPCHSPDEERWFRLVVAPLEMSAPRRVLTVHVRLDGRHGEREYRHDETPMRTICAWCGEAELHDGEWGRRLDPLGEAAVSHGICPRCADQFAP